MEEPSQLFKAVTGLFAAQHGQPLGDWVAERRSERMSWRRISDLLREESGGAIDVSHVTLIAWYGDADKTNGDNSAVA